MIDCMITTTYICNIELIRIDAGGGRLGPGTWWIDFLEYVYGKYVDASTRVDEQRGWDTVEEDSHSCFVGFALRGMECVNLRVTVWTVIVLHGSTSCGLPPVQFVEFVSCCRGTSAAHRVVFFLSASTACLPASLVAAAVSWFTTAVARCMWRWFLIRSFLLARFSDPVRVASGLIARFPVPSKGG